MRFLADMGVDVCVVEWLRIQGHDVLHLRDEGLQRVPDDRVFEKAIAEARVILTFDLDFADPIALARGRSPSVILFQLGNPRVSQVKDRLASVLATPKLISTAEQSSWWSTLATGYATCPLALTEH